MSVPPAAAATLWHGGRIVTLDGDSSVHSAMAVAGGRVVALGDDESVRAAAGEPGRVVDLRGRCLVPGLIDGHAHLDREGLKERWPRLEGVSGRAAILESLREIVAASEPGEWVVTMPAGDRPDFEGVSARWRRGELPDRDELDRVAPDNPLYVRAPWGFWSYELPLVSLANSRALRAAGLEGAAALPPGAELETDGGGRATGRIIERTRMPIVELTHFPDATRFTAGDRDDGLRRSLTAYHACGTTGAFEGHGVSEEVLGSYQRVGATTGVRMRMQLVHSLPEQRLRELARPGADVAAALAPRRIAPRVSCDGVAVQCGIGDEDRARAGAAPYTGWAGFLYDHGLPDGEVDDLLDALAGAGERVAAIARTAAPHFTRLRGSGVPADRRWVLAHVGIVTDADLDAYAELGCCLTAHVNGHIGRQGCRLAGHDCGSACGAPPPLKDGARLAPLRTMLERGLPVALASDNAPPSMFEAIWQAVARRCLSCGRVLDPDERLSREQALRAATVNGARLTWEEHERGWLGPGTLADFAVLDRDPLTVAEDDLRHTRSDITVVGGEVVYDRDGEVLAR